MKERHNEGRGDDKQYLQSLQQPDSSATFSESKDSKTVLMGCSVYYRQMQPSLGKTRECQLIFDTDSRSLELVLAALQEPPEKSYHQVKNIIGQETSLSVVGIF